MPRNDLGSGVHVRRCQLVADLFGNQAAERDFLVALRCSLWCQFSLGLVQERDHDDL